MYSPYETEVVSQSAFTAIPKSLIMCFQKKMPPVIEPLNLRITMITLDNLLMVLRLSLMLSSGVHRLSHISTSCAISSGIISSILK